MEAGKTADTKENGPLAGINVDQHLHDKDRQFRKCWNEVTSQRIYERTDSTAIGSGSRIAIIGS